MGRGGKLRKRGVLSSSVALPTASSVTLPTSDRLRYTDNKVRNHLRVRSHKKTSTQTQMELTMQRCLSRYSLSQGYGQAELECGWITGPFLASDLPVEAVVNRRFGIKQNSGDQLKVRLIDDFSASGVNSTVQVETAPKLHTLDVVAGLCLELLRVSPHQSFVGKTVDLSSAYRQLGIAPSSHWVSYIAVFNPRTRKPEIYAMRALPFGASRSVYGFLRVAHSLWWLGVPALEILWSSFFDDFITLARESESATVGIVVEQFFRLLGWQISGGEKDLPFRKCFKALGVEINFSNWCDGCVLFRNTEKRVTELLETIDGILRSGFLDPSAALSLRGRMQFAKSQVWGRASRLCLSAVTSHAYSGSGPKISDHLMCFFLL